MNIKDIETKQKNAFVDNLCRAYAEKLKRPATTLSESMWMVHNLRAVCNEHHIFMHAMVARIEKYQDL